MKNTNNFDLTIFISGMKEVFNPKKISKELTTMTLKDNLLLFFLLAVQFIAFFLTSAYNLMSNLSLIVACLTIVNLILVNRGRITNYAWGTASAIFWLVVAIQSQLFGDVFSQTYYVVMQFVGIYAWKKSLDKTETKEVAPRKISLKVALIALLGFVVIYLVVLATSSHLNGQQIFLDATLLPLAIIGQLLMTFGYRSQWLAWFLINAINIVIWYNNWQLQGDAAFGMFILQILMFINAIYGSYLWFKKPSEDTYETAKAK